MEIWLIPIRVTALPGVFFRLARGVRQPEEETHKSFGIRKGTWPVELVSSAALRPFAIMGFRHKSGARAEWSGSYLMDPLGFDNLSQWSFAKRDFPVVAASTASQFARAWAEAPHDNLRHRRQARLWRSLSLPRSP